MTYSGHKGKGYEVQVAETCESDNAVQMITHVEVTPSSGSDSVVTTRMIDELSERGIGPSELWADTSYGSGRNGWEAERRGTELVSPVGGRSHKEPHGGGDEPVRLTASDFYIDAMATRDGLNKSVDCSYTHRKLSRADGLFRVSLGSQIPHLTWLGAAWCAFRGCPGVDQG